MLNKEAIQKIEQGSLGQALQTIASLFPGKVVFSSSLGQEDQVITDVIFRNDLDIRIMTIDTGRLFPETYDLLAKTEARYKKKVEIYFPEAADVEEYVRTKGINGFYESAANRRDCCQIRKVRPLDRALKGASVWVTGLRAEQSANRKEMKIIEWDEQKELYKFNPLIRWSHEEVLKYIGEFFVPVNTLHEKGFLSIGCAPCTRAIMTGEDPRAGRWWWENSQKECGLHQNLIK